MEVFITYHIKFFLVNKYNSHVRTTRNPKVTSTANIYEKTVMKRKVFRGIL